MKDVYNRLLEIEDLRGKVSINESQDVIAIEFHEFLTLSIYMNHVLLSISPDGAKLGRSDYYVDMNRGLTHWHHTIDEELVDDIAETAGGDLVYVESRGFFARHREWGNICSNALTILDKVKFEKKKEKYMSKEHLRIYTGNSIIKRDKYAQQQ